MSRLWAQLPPGDLEQLLLLGRVLKGRYGQKAIHSQRRIRSCLMSGVPTSAISSFISTSLVDGAFNPLVGSAMVLYLAIGGQVGRGYSSRKIIGRTVARDCGFAHRSLWRPPLVAGPLSSSTIQRLQLSTNSPNFRLLRIGLTHSVMELIGRAWPVSFVKVISLTC